MRYFVQGFIIAVGIFIVATAFTDEPNPKLPTINMHVEPGVYCRVSGYDVYCEPRPR